MTVWHSIREWGALATLSIFLVGGIVYSVVHDPNAETKKLRAANVIACQRSLTKSILFQQGMGEASAVMRYIAVKQAQEGDKVLADSSLHSAIRFEAIGKKYLAITPTDCSAQYPAIP